MIKRSICQIAVLIGSLTLVRIDTRVIDVTYDDKRNCYYVTLKSDNPAVSTTATFKNVSFQPGDTIQTKWYRRDNGHGEVEYRYSHSENPPTVVR